jgi:hypothetical protein
MIAARVLTITASVLVLLIIGLLAWQLQPGVGPASRALIAQHADLGSHVPDTGATPVDAYGDVVDTAISETAPEFRDPFFAFVISIAEGDSLGHWSRADLQQYLEWREQESSLPLEYFQSLERRAVATNESESRRGVRVERVWCLTLQDEMKYSLPYDVLGYKPGSLSMARELIFSEWRLGDRNLYVPIDGDIAVVPVTSLTLFRLDSGWIVLDVDGWLDKILGGKLDDCWAEGFVICRQDGAIRGLTLSQNRKLRPLCSEFDFSTDEVLAMGGPFARGVDVYVRPWVAPPEGTPSRVWQFKD